MPPKKHSPNGFMIFTYEWKAKYGQRMSLSEATAATGKVWADMNAQERAPYIAKAKDEKLGLKHSAEKLTCTGQPVKLVEKQKTEDEQRERQIKRSIETTVRNSLKNEVLEHQSYFFIMVNYFTKTLKGGVYVPAEISVCEYSLKDGVQRLYHTHVNPGVNIYGHQYEAQHHSDTTHMLPLPPKAMGDTDLARIYNDILEFVRCKETGEYAPLYTANDCIPIVESVLFFLMTDRGANQIKLDIYPIQHLFFILKEATCKVGEIEKPSTHFITDAIFERDHFEYTVGCNFHDDLDRNRYCTKSYVTRWGYVFSDYMCADLAITLIPERHVPKGTNVNAGPPPLSNFSDCHSTISKMTDTSYATKAMSEHKFYRDDQKSLISEQSTSNMWSTMPEASFSGVDSNDFPSLGNNQAKQRKKTPIVQKDKIKGTKIGNALDSYLYNNFADNDDGDNPWSSRSRNVPPQPTDTSVFSVDIKTEDLSTADIDDFNTMSGIGRGRNINRSLNTTGSSCGRGRFLFP